MIHSSATKPRVYPYGGTASPTQIDRVQDLAGTITMNRTKIEEVGRVGVVNWRAGVPSINLTLRQLEYGEMDFYNQLANKAIANATVQLTDFKTSMVDICGFETDDSGTFLSSIWYPNCRTSGFSVSIGDPDSLVERSFTLVGENETTFKDGGKYFISRDFTAVGGASEEFTVSDGTIYPHAVEDVDNSGQYLLKVVRYTAAGVTSKLVYTTDYSYSNSTHKLTVVTTISGDTIKVYYSALTAGTQTFWTDNDSDAAGLHADSCSIYIQTNNYLYRLQSVGIDVSFDRYDIKEIGNANVVARGVRDTTVSITLGRILEAWTLESILRGEVSTYPKLDITKFVDNVNVIVKIYSTSAKTTFKMGYKFTNLAPTGMDAGIPLNDYLTRGCTLEGETGLVTNLESALT